MMRVIAGNYRSRQLKSCDGEITRPTLDKVKEAVFSSIGPYFDGGEILDLFSGSGNIGIESLSRGMEKCIFVDCEYKAIQVIKENLKNLKIEDQEVWKMDYHKALQRCAQERKQFNLIYLDPPYKEQKIQQILFFIEENNLLADSGVIVCESLKEDVFAPKIGRLEIKKETNYGISKITIYRKGQL